MARRKEEEGPITDENQRPSKYDEDSLKAREEAIARRQAQDSNFEPVPEGGLFEGEDPLSDRAEDARQRQREMPVFDHADGPPSPVEVIAAREQNRRRMGEDEPIGGEDPFLEPREKTQPMGVKHPIMVVIFYGGRFRLMGFSSFDYMRGSVQKEKGTKRIFRYVGEDEWQEIKASGESVIR